MGFIIAFLVLAILTGIFGFGGFLAAATVGIVQILFYIFIGLFLLSLIMRIVRGPSNPPRV